MYWRQRTDTETIAGVRDEIDFRFLASADCATAVCDLQQSAHTSSSRFGCVTIRSECPNRERPRDVPSESLSSRRTGRHVTKDAYEATADPSDIDYRARFASDWLARDSVPGLYLQPLTSSLGTLTSQPALMASKVVAFVGVGVKSLNRVSVLRVSS